MKVICFMMSFLGFIMIPWVGYASHLEYFFPEDKEFFCLDTYRKNFFDRHHSVNVTLENCFLLYPTNKIQCHLKSNEANDHGSYKTLKIVSEEDPYKCIQLSNDTMTSGGNVTLSDVKLWGIIMDTVDNRWFYQRRIQQVYDFSRNSLGGNYNKKRFEFTFMVGEKQLCQYSIEYDKKSIEFYN
ncbi:hypothetical protein BCR36DRAFT_374768 [Piromyces finnis]|uniref:Uncharacterized protein n=1 Tax=Piromyces finnis TaxID=1754191 RepID=A0A1Y1UX72_9FUNG|nr:hypothetical protein BCR36DRAFT_374768 [Piromyces finnis]|eukprot:ORX42098.1 hypothetical protein BCR36DRAFT_374768 [Piromyces finnis]